jgi:hypothetical protein
MTKQDPEEFHTCGCRARRHHATCPIHDPAIDEPEEIETLPPIPDPMIPEWVDRVEELENL